jgi:hypothetical protein
MFFHVALMIALISAHRAKFRLVMKSNFATGTDMGKPDKVMKLDCIDSLNFEKALKIRTGAQMRKDKRQELRVERVKASNLYAQQRKARKNHAQEMSNREKIRFKLGNKVEVLTGSSLIDLVKITAPYIFAREVDEDDEDDEIVLVQDQFPSSQSCSRLSTMSTSENGWKVILNSQSLPVSSESPSENDRVDYFTLCLACHFATVATYVPTDVDSKIRGHCWFSFAYYLLGFKIHFALGLTLMRRC